MSHLQVRCEEWVMAAHQRDSKSHGRPDFPVAELLLSPSGQQVSLLEEPQEFCSADLGPMSTRGVLEEVCYCYCSFLSTGSILAMLLFIGSICL